MPLDKEIQEAQKQLKLFQEAIEKEKKELTKIRSDKASEAHVTLAHLQKEIPTLEAKFNSLNTEIVKLNNMIAKKQEAYNKQETSAKLKYDELEAKLRSEIEHIKGNYGKKEAALDFDRKDLEAKYSLLNIDLTARESVLKTATSHLSTREQGLADAKKDFSDQQKLFHAEVHSSKVSIDKEKAYIKEQKELLTDRDKELKDREFSIHDREVKAEAAIAKEKEFNARQKAQDDRQDKLNRDTKDLNEKDTFLKAEVVRLNKREGDLIRFQEKLDLREVNIQLAEEGIRNGKTV